MKYKLTKGEKETTLLYNQTHEAAVISTYDPSLRRRLSRFVERYPELCKRTDKRNYSDYAQYEIAKSRVSIRLISPKNEAQKKAASTQAKQQGLGKR